MAEQYTTVTHNSFLTNIMNSIIGALIGVLLFFGSFVLLWINEGRVDLSKIARQSIAVSADVPNPAHEGKLVAAAGALQSNEQLGDSGFLAAGSYLLLERKAEMYGWHENKETRTEKNVGGSSSTITRYSYEKQWLTDSFDSQKFNHPEGHENPPMIVKSSTQRVKDANVGVYKVDPATLTLPPTSPLALTPEVAQVQDNWSQSGDYLVSAPSATSAQPQVGDVRISYQVVANNQPVTLFGKVSGAQLTPFTSGNETLYRAFSGDRAAAIATLHSEYTILSWILRLVGFLMMWVGLALSFGPVNSVLNILPALGSISSLLIGLAMLGVALSLSVITILVAIVAHNLILLLVTVALLGSGAIFVVRKRNGQRLAPLPNG